MHLFLYDLRHIGLLSGMGSVQGGGGETANPIFCLTRSPHYDKTSIITVKFKTAFKTGCVF